MATSKCFGFTAIMVLVLASGAHGAEGKFKVEWQTCATVDAYVPPATGDVSACFVVDMQTFDKKLVVKVAGGLGIKGDVMVLGVKARTVLVLTGEFPTGTSKAEALKQMQLELTNRIQSEKFREEARAAARFEARLKGFAVTTIRDEPRSREELKKLLEANASRARP